MVRFAGHPAVEPPGVSTRGFIFSGSPASAPEAGLQGFSLIASIFFHNSSATGITDSELLRGVHYDARGASTQSLVVRSKSGTVRRVDARHRLHKLQEYNLL